jgi:hypothetical protein
MVQVVFFRGVRRLVGVTSAKFVTLTLTVALPRQ